MKYRSALYLAFAATPLIAGCGGSSSSSDSDTPADGGDNKVVNSQLEALYGSWHEPRCRSELKSQGGNETIDKRSFVVVNSNNLKLIEKTYASSDMTCMGSTTEDVKEFSYADAGKTTDADTGLEMRKITLDPKTPPYNWTVYVTPQLNQIMVSYGSTTHAVKMSFDALYYKEGASRAYKAGEKNITVLGHNALNFKTGETEADANAKLDASTSAWSPSDKYIAGESRDNGIWLRTFKEGDFNYLHDAGAVGLEAVTTVPTSWLRKYSSGENQAEPIPAMRKNHSYVIKLDDGSHAKFKVLNTPDPKMMNWPLLVEYQLM